LLKSASAKGYKTTNDTAQKHVSSSLNMTTAGYDIQEILAVPIHRKQVPETPDLGLCPK
jgi:hypothetical protein